ncbi:MAG: hypothetical protein M4579_004316 [Chaenotheca gracillima]|nr:MAG: hypothetical protein M4579_004316 [Chaenotheca gracillima]
MVSVLSVSTVTFQSSVARYAEVLRANCMTDNLGHVNNVTYVRYAESARVNWAKNIAYYIDPAHKQEWMDMYSPRGFGMILRSIKIDYKFPMTWPDRVTVYHKLRSAPSASSDAFHLDVTVLSELHQRCAARCVEDIVVYDYRQGRKTALQPFMQDVFQDTFRQQEEARIFWSKQVRMLIDRVEKLEKASWDREGAVEDLGSASSS